MNLDLFNNFDKERQRLMVVASELAETTISKESIDLVEGHRKMIVQFTKRVSGARLAVTAPLVKRQKELIASEKEYLDPLAEIIGVVEDQLNAYYQNQMEINDRRKADIEKEHKEEIEKAESFDDLLQADVKRSINEAIVNDESRGYREKTDLELVDIALVPQQFLLVNWDAVKAEFKEGVEVPGIMYKKKAVRTGR